MKKKSPLFGFRFGSTTFSQFDWLPAESSLIISNLIGPDVSSCQNERDLWIWKFRLAGKKRSKIYHLIKPKHYRQRRPNKKTMSGKGGKSKSGKVGAKPQRHYQAELVCSSPLDESTDASAKETTMSELELMPQSTLQLCWSTWLLKPWSWQETLPERKTKGESFPDTCSWPSETTKSWTSCSKEWPLPQVLCCPTSKQFHCPRSNLLLKTKPSKWAGCDAAIAQACNINKTRTSLSQNPAFLKATIFFKFSKFNFNLLTDVEFCLYFT